MRRFIDVVFVQPKSRYFVVLHEGQFWQLPRMNLTSNSWVFRLLYKGSLKDIFVAKSQAVACERLSRTLKTYDLPKELHGLSAQRFLDWWEMNDYKWLSTKDVISLDVAQAPKAVSEPKPAPKTVITPQALEILQKKRLNSLPTEQAPLNLKPTPQTTNEPISQAPMPSPTDTPATTAFGTPINQARPTTNTAVPPKPATRSPLSKIHEFNAQYAKQPQNPASAQPPVQRPQATPQPNPQQTAPIQPRTLTQNTEQVAHNVEQARPSPTMPSTQPTQAQIRPQTQIRQPHAESVLRAMAPAPTPEPRPAPTVQTTPQPKPAPSPADDEMGFDIFDNLLKELNEEVLHG